MRSHAALIALSIGFALAGCAPTPKDQAMPAKAEQGSGQACIEVAAIADTIVRDDRTIDFVLQQIGRPIYRNVLSQSCPLLGIERTFAWRSTGARLCMGDPIQVLQNGAPIPGPTCPLSRFKRLP